MHPKKMYDFFIRPQNANNTYNRTQLELLLGSNQARFILPNLESTNRIQFGQPLTTGVNQSQRLLAGSTGHIQHLSNVGNGQFQGLLNNTISQPQAPLTNGIGQPQGVLAGGIGQSQGSLTNGIGQSQGSATNVIGQSQGLATNGISQSQGLTTNGIGQSQGLATNGIGQSQGLANNGIEQPQVQSTIDQFANSNDNFQRMDARGNKQQASNNRPVQLPKTVKQPNQRRTAQSQSRRSENNLETNSQENLSQSNAPENVQASLNTLSGTETASFNQFFSNPFSIPQEQPSSNQPHYDNSVRFPENSQASYNPVNNDPQGAVHIPLQMPERNIYIYPEDLGIPIGPSGPCISALPPEIIPHNNIPNLVTPPHGFRTEFSPGLEVLPYSSFQQRYTGDHYLGYSNQPSNQYFTIRDEPPVPPYYIATASEPSVRFDNQPQEYFMSSRRQQFQKPQPDRPEDIYFQRVRPSQAPCWPCQGRRQGRGMPPSYQQPMSAGGNLVGYRRGQRKQQPIGFSQRTPNHRSRQQGYQQVLRGAPFHRGEEQRFPRRGNPPLRDTPLVHHSMGLRQPSLDSMLTDFGSLYPNLKPQIVQELTPQVVQLIDLPLPTVDQAPTQGTPPVPATNSLPVTYALYLTPNSQPRGVRQPTNRPYKDPTTQGAGQDSNNNGEVTSTNNIDEPSSNSSSPNLVIDCDDQDQDATV